MMNVMNPVGNLRCSPDINCCVTCGNAPKSLKQLRTQTIKDNCHKGSQDIITPDMLAPDSSDAILQVWQRRMYAVYIF